MDITKHHEHSLIGSNLYLAPPTSPPRRKSPVFFLLVTVVLATGAVFVLCISRLGKELQDGDMQNKGWFKLFSIGYTIVVAIATIIFLTISVSFFKAVYPAPAPFRSSFNALKASAKATIICNFLSSFLWCTALGIQAREIWASLSHEKDDDNTDISGVESDGRFWVRVGITAGVMLGSLALGWFSLQGVWRNKHCLNFTAPSTELPSLSCSDR